MKTTTRQCREWIIGPFWLETDHTTIDMDLGVLEGEGKHQSPRHGAFIAPDVDGGNLERDKAGVEKHLSCLAGRLVEEQHHVDGVRRLIPEELDTCF
jgi:hypothetical protein